MCHRIRILSDASETIEGVETASAWQGKILSGNIGKEKIFVDLCRKNGVRGIEIDQVVPIATTIFDDPLVARNFGERRHVPGAFPKGTVTGTAE